MQPVLLVIHFEEKENLHAKEDSEPLDSGPLPEPGRGGLPGLAGHPAALGGDFEGRIKSDIITKKSLPIKVRFSNDYRNYEIFRQKHGHWRDNYVNYCINL